MRTDATADARGSRPYANPYVAGFGLGLVLLAAFALAGRGLGASGAFGSVASAAVQRAAPADVERNPYFARYLARGGPSREWLVYELLGVLAGGAASAFAAGRLRRDVERGPRLPPPARLAFAGAGGALMGGGAVLAHGCTSGLALTGGALLGTGAWLFLAVALTTALALAPLARRLWS
jgi:hypothetical protein